jgi:fatty acid desaturase
MLPPPVSSQHLKAALSLATQHASRSPAAPALAILSLHALALTTLLLPLPGPLALLLPSAILSLSNLYLALLIHEAAHLSLLPSRRANLLLGAATGILAATPFGSYRRGHIAHHRHTGLQDLDPTVAPQRPLEPHPARDLGLLIAYRLRIPVLYWAGVLIPYLTYDLRSPRRAPHLLSWAASLCATASLYAAICAASPLGPLAAAPLLIGFVGGAVLYEHLFTMHQHIGLASAPPDQPHGPRHQVNWTRSIPLPPLPSTLLLHFNLHKEHHLAPGLPWHQLPALHRALRSLRPDLYAFTRQDTDLLWRRDASPSDLLTPRYGDPP